MAITALHECLDTEGEFVKAKELFDPHDSQSLTEQWLVECCKKIFDERRNLTRTLDDLESIVHALGNFLNGAILVIMLIVLDVAFSSGPLADFTVTIATMFLSLSFIFADFCKNVFNSFIFLFIRHPFDIGERVYIGSSPEAMYVDRMELLTTTFHVWDGRVITYPNYSLHMMDIVNISRSGKQYDSVFFNIDHTTPMAKIDALDKAYHDFLRSQPNEFDDSNSGMYLREILDTNKLVLGFFTYHQTNWEHAEHVPRRHSMLIALKVFCGCFLGC